MAEIICGVDVCAKHLDASIGRDGAAQRFGRDPEGIAALRDFCETHKVDLVVMEATGGYEKLPFGLLWAHAMPAAIVNPRAVRDFAKAMGLLEKTDRLDARAIAWYAATKAVSPRPPESPHQDKLRALVTRLRQLTDLRTSQKLQRQLVTDPDVISSFDDVMGLLGRQIRALELQIATLIDQDPLWRELDSAFRTLKGVADRTVASLMAHLPEIGTVSGKAIAKLVGLAPLANDSGQSAGPRTVRGGRRPVRDILYLVAEIARRHEPDFKAFAAKLAAAGKPKKVIRIALARKLLVRLNAKARDIRAQHTAPA